MSSHAPDRNLALELVRVTEAAAMGAGRWIGRGDKNAADQAAVDAMRAMLDTVAMDGVVVIGEGEKDEAPMLYNGERGRRGRARGRRRRRPARGHAPDGARPAERDRRDRRRGARLDVLPRRRRLHGEDRRRRGRDRRDRHHRHARPRTCRRSRRRKAGASTDIRVVVLERDRHEQLIGELREAGARVNLIRDGDVAPAIAAARPETGVDLLYGIGGTPEGVISAAALKCVGGGIQGRLWPRSPRSAQALLDAGLRSRARADDRRPRRRRRRLRRRHRRHDRRPAARRPLRSRRSDHGFDRHALALRHRPPDRSAPQPRQADAFHGREF